MKKFTCKQLKGACDFIITGDTPKEVAEKSKQHAMEMLATGDTDHKKAMEEMMELTPEEQKDWWNNFVAMFNQAKENED